MTREGKRSLHDDELSKLLKEALEKPGVREVMKVYGQWEDFLARFMIYNQTLQDKEVVTLSSSTNS